MDLYDVAIILALEQTGTLAEGSPQARGNTCCRALRVRRIDSVSQRKRFPVFDKHENIPSSHPLFGDDGSWVSMRRLAPILHFRAHPWVCWNTWLILFPLFTQMTPQSPVSIQHKLCQERDGCLDVGHGSSLSLPSRIKMLKSQFVGRRFRQTFFNFFVSSYPATLHF